MTGVEDGDWPARSMFTSTRAQRLLSHLTTVWSGPGSAWRLALGLLITLRIVLGLAAFLAVEFGPINEATGEHRERVIQGGEPWNVFLSSWQRWDALWYQYIAEEGYRGGGSAAAFYPLYPLLSRAAAVPFGGQVV
jgi:hypothetical protein